MNEYRINYFVDHIKNRNPETIGIYKLSVNDREDSIFHSATLKLLKNISKLEKSILIFEPHLNEEFISNMYNVKIKKI